MGKAPEELEEGCFAVTVERKYYHVGQCFIKRSLRPAEYRTGFKGLYVPRQAKERLKNEADSMRYIRQHTQIPVPAVFCDFEDADAYYIITEYVEGVNMADLTDDQKRAVLEELQGHLATLQSLKSSKLGGPSGLVVPPYRVSLKSDEDHWVLQASECEEYVFCHNDLSQHNVIVDPATLKITAIIDWEYAGFYPAYFEGQFYRRPGGSAAIGDEVDDTHKLLEFLNSRRIV